MHELPATKSCGVRNSSKGENLDWFYQLYNKCCPEEERELFGKSFSQSHYYKVEYLELYSVLSRTRTIWFFFAQYFNSKLNTWTALANFKRATSLTIILHTFKWVTIKKQEDKNAHIQMRNWMKSIQRRQDQNCTLGNQLKSIQRQEDHNWSDSQPWLPLFIVWVPYCPRDWNILENWLMMTKETRSY